MFVIQQTAKICKRLYTRPYSFKKMSSFDTKVIDTKDLSVAVEALKRGDVVAFPTETVYGLGASAYDDSAIEKIYSAKGRPSDNPLIVHISNDAMLKELVHPEHLPKPGDTTSKLIKSFWPGPLTILFRKSDKVSMRVTAGLDFVAVRMPSHPIARKLIEESNLPLAAPSANKSGRPSPTLASHVLEDLKGRIPVIVDGGPANVGVESTVVDLNRNPPLILRPGGVTFEQLKQIVPEIQVYEKSVHGTELEKAPPTPGLKYTHYSPTAKVILFEESDNLKDLLAKRLKDEKQLNKDLKIAVIQTHKSFQYKDEDLEGVQLYRLGDENAPDVIASGIFKALRDLDHDSVNLVLVEGISEKNEGLAVMNRLRKAASEIVHK